MGGSANWADIVLRGLDRTNYFVPYEVHGEGGVGYVQTGAAKLAFAGLAQSIPTDAAIVVVFGSRNDGGGYSPDSISKAATDLHAQIRKRAQGAKLLVIGPPWVDENVPNNILTIRDRLKIAATKAGATFVDPIADEWFFGADAALIGSDGVHPTDAGVQYMAERILPSSRASSHPSGSCTGLRTRIAGLLSSMGSRPRIPRSKRSARSVGPWGEGHELAGQLLEFGHCPVNCRRARAVRIGDVIEVAVADEILRRTIGVEFRQP